MGIGFIGGGNMATALIKGITGGGLYAPSDIFVYDPNEEAMNRLKSELGVQSASSGAEAAKLCDLLVLAVKPQVLETAVAELRDQIDGEKLIISIAAGKTIKEIESYFNKPIRLVRVMPNTAALVQEAMSALTGNTNLREGDLERAKALLEACGRAEIVPETLMDAVTAVSGSSPAFVFLMIEAMADGAVACGMPRAQALTFAAQAVYGSAKLMLETGKHPGELKDMVCSPAGTTIAGVRELEEGGFRGLAMDAVIEAFERSQEMGKQV
ncbi:MAG: pyrroline-5-carboxylate reductase [Lachnospiraceae bacterium]|nr:pyrroline-5-carboxylate reductase [Lachnospiraceae bacterium]